MNWKFWYLIEMTLQSSKNFVDEFSLEILYKSTFRYVNQVHNNNTSIQNYSGHNQISSVSYAEHWSLDSPQSFPSVCQCVLLEIYQRSGGSFNAFLCV